MRLTKRERKLMDRLIQAQNKLRVERDLNILLQQSLLVVVKERDALQAKWAAPIECVKHNAPDQRPGARKDQHAT